MEVLSRRNRNDCSRGISCQVSAAQYLLPVPSEWPITWWGHVFNFTLVRSTEVDSLLCSLHAVGWVPNEWITPRSTKLYPVQTEYEMLHIRLRHVQTAALLLDTRKALSILLIPTVQMGTLIFSGPCESLLMGPT